MKALVLLLLAAPAALAQSVEPPQRTAYNRGTALVASGQNDAAYAAFAEAAQVAESRGDTAVSVRARRVLAQMDYNHGARLVWMQRTQDALPYFEAGLANDPANARNALGLAQALARLGREDDALTAFVTARDLALRQGDDALARTVRASLRDHFLATLRPYLDRLDATLPAPVASTVLDRLDLAEAHGVTGDDVRYLRARTLLALGLADSALAVANASLANHRGTQDAAAPFQFVRGEALRALGRRTEAQAAYRAARYGIVAAWADERLRTF